MPVTAEVPAATEVALAVAVRPETPDALTAAAMFFASFVIEPSCVVTPPIVTVSAADVLFAVPIDWFASE